MTYQNPVITGFHPDPSICRVGEDYYLVTSSFEYFPGVPIFHSRDLVHWRQIGHCLHRQSQLDLQGTKPSHGIWAPTIRHHNGTFYMVTTLVPKWKNFYVTAKDPAGPWSEPVWLEQGGIDPDLFFDDDGEVYLTTSGNQMCRIDIETGKQTDATQVPWPGSGGSCLEAPHLYKVNGKYYLMAAEGGTHMGHMETIARAETPYGPYETCPNNPILSNRNRNPSEEVQATGHGDLIQDHNGNWWMVFLAVRFNRGGHPRCHHIGRETFLAPVTWNEGWPVVNRTGDVPSLNIPEDAPFLEPHPWPKPQVRDDFSSLQFGLDWNFVRNPEEENYDLTSTPGFVCLRGSKLTLSDAGSPTLIARRQEHFHFQATTLLNFDPTNPNEEAGMTVRMNETNHYEIGIKLEGNARRILVRRRVGDMKLIANMLHIPDGPIRIRISSDREFYYFHFSPEDGAFETITKANVRYISQEVSGGFTGVYIGLYATGNGKPAETPACFDYFDYEPLNA